MVAEAVRPRYARSARNRKRLHAAGAIPAGSFARHTPGRAFRCSGGGRRGRERALNCDCPWVQPTCPSDRTGDGIFQPCPVVGPTLRPESCASIFACAASLREADQTIDVADFDRVIGRARYSDARSSPACQVTPPDKVFGRGTGEGREQPSVPDRRANTLILRLQDRSTERSTASNVSIRWVPGFAWPGLGQRATAPAIGGARHSRLIARSRGDGGRRGSRPRP